MNRRGFLKISLAGAVSACTGLPALAAQAEGSVWPWLHVLPFAGNYTPLPTTTLADMREIAAKRAVATTMRRMDGGEIWVTYESGCAQTLFGWFAELDGQLIAAERFDRPFDVIATDQLTFQVVLT